MTLFAGIGGTAIISVPIGYYQDLLRDRPGAAGAMLAVQKLVSDVLAAGCFALGTGLGSYESVAALGVALTLTGAAGLHLVDHRLGRQLPQT